MEQNEIRQRISFRCSPLLDLALVAQVLLNPERFAARAPWLGPVRSRLAADLPDKLRQALGRIDLFEIVLALEGNHPRLVTEALAELALRHHDLAGLLTPIWAAIAPEVGARAGLLAQSALQEQNRLEQSDPAAFIESFSDRVTLTGDTLLLQWGGGLRVPLTDLDRMIFIPSAFCPRRLMFYHLEGQRTQIFFYDPLRIAEPEESQEAPESLVLGFAALADPTRLRLLRLVALESLPAQEMARRLGLNESTVSRHLRILAEAGLVGRDRQEGKFIFYGLQADRIDRLALLARSYLGRDGR